MFSLSLLHLKVLVGVAFFGTVVALVIAITRIKEEVPTDSREYMDPLPFKLRLVWPLVKLVAHYTGDRLSAEILEKYNTSLKRSGLNYLITPEQFFGLKIVTGALVAGVTILAGYFLLGGVNWVYVIGSFFLGMLMPSMTMRDLKKKREKAIVKALPTFLDYLTMTVQAGMNMTGALQQAVEKGPDGPLRVEFSKVLRDIKAGMSRTEAIREMSNRLDVKEINAFATSIIQAERTGASVGDSLKIQADQRRAERFQRAEKLAMEAPVKLIFPLVAFIFPMTFLALGFPIVMKLIHEL